MGKQKKEVESKQLKIAIAASEAVPFAKTGGLGDVIGSLPKALKKLGCDVKIFLPKYSMIDDEIYGLKPVWGMGEILIIVGEHQYFVHLHQAKLPGTSVEVNFIDCSHYFDRRWIYTNDNDENERFILFNKAVIEIIQRMKWKPDIIHCNDWQTGLIPAYLKENYQWDKLFENTGTVMTIHNIGYPGKFHAHTVEKANLNRNKFYPGGPFEFYDNFSFLKTGLVYSDVINTVSNTYANEILTPEFGSGLEGVLTERKEDLFGILNGADYEIWNPETDKYIPYHYSLHHPENKLKVKEELLKKMRLPFSENRPVIGIISRMVDQKGFDLVEHALHELLKLDVQFVILGSGEERYESLFQWAAYQYPEKVSTFIGYNNELSHLIEAGADMFLMPSIYEPCGLNQIYSLKYGTVPIVRKTGGLADTVFDWHEFERSDSGKGNGFVFSNPTATELYYTVLRAISEFQHKPVWQKIMKNGMKLDFSWEQSAKKYLELYQIAQSNKIKRKVA